MTGPDGGVVYMEGTEYVAYMHAYRTRTDGDPVTDRDIAYWLSLRTRDRSLNRWRWIMFGATTTEDD